jgi:hypothetical protein
MVNCPRCGFTQPKDQYCAKCGVDMLAYKPAEKPLSQKLATSWLVQVALLCLVLVSVYMIIKGQSHKSLEERFAQLEAPAQTATTRSAQTAPPPPPAKFAQNSRAQAPPPPPPPQNAQAGMQNENRINQPATAAGQTPYPPGAEGLNKAAEDYLGEKPSPAAGQVKNLRVQFLEVQRMVVNDLVNNSRNLNSYDTYNGGVVVDLANRMSNYARGMRVLDSGQSYPVRLNQPVVLFKGVRDDATGANIGVTVQLTPVATEENGVTVQTEVTRVLKDATGGLDEHSFQESFIIPKDGGAYMSGTLPRRELTEADKTAYNNAGVLRVLNSGAFQKSTTDFVILIEGK